MTGMTRMRISSSFGFSLTQSWRELLLDLKRRGMKQEPKLAIGDGALGFWTALREVFATTREQRCWVHKTMNGDCAEFCA